MAARGRPKIILLTIFLSLVGVGVAYYQVWKRQQRRDNPNFEIAESFDLYPKMARAIEKCNQVRILEGLPHQLFENGAMADELANKKTVQIGGFPFYATPIAVSVEDASALKNYYIASDSFAPFRGEKACGGYHPDWCVEWSDSTRTFYVQFCFGCDEMMTFHNDDKLRCEVGAEAMSVFERILGAYRKERLLRAY